MGSVSLAGICGDSVSIGHPALTPDGLRLYFVTDQLPGGFGGKDIWYVDRLEEKMGATSECRRIDQYGRGRDVSLCEREWRVLFCF